MKTTIVDGGHSGKIIAEVEGSRKEALEHLLSHRMFGSFLLMCADNNPGRIEMEWLLLTRVNARVAAVSFASRPAHWNWSYLDDYDIPRTVGEAVSDAVQTVKQAVSQLRK